MWEDLAYSHSQNIHSEQQKLYVLNVITKTRLFKYIENFTSKNWKFSDKNFDIFSIFPLKT